MTRKLKLGLGATAVFAPYAIGTWHLGPLLGLTGKDLWIARGGLWLIGLIAIGVVVTILLRRRTAPPKPPVEEGREIDTAVAGARSRLAASRKAGGTGLQDLPLVLILGPEGSAKTTSVVRSGQDPELLSGEVFRGEAIVPTRTINIWYSQKILFLEAGGRVTGDIARWGRLMHHLQPRRLRAALGRGGQAPRIALVCFSCEEFLRPNANESVAAAARPLRARLSELSLELGVPLPVYVVFTKADRIPHFPEYVRNFARDEVREVFGSTLPLDLGPADSYAERAFKRVDRAFQRMFHSIAIKRLKFLPRENVPDNTAGAYEFPREFRKVIPLATQFLVDLCRPSQLELSQVLRGFYFVGVRPVIVSDVPFETAPEASATSESVPIGATRVFNPGRMPGAVAAKLADPLPASRKVPQWVFLERLFPEVLLKDRVAMALTQGGRRVDLLRRVLLGGTIAAAIVVASGITVSYLGNRRLQESATAATRGLSVLATDGDDIPTLDALRRLDAARSELEKLARYERNGPPWRLRWGLYSGAPLYPRLRQEYFVSLDRRLLARTRDSLLSVLRVLPNTPTQSSDYGATYTTLKAYLITTFRPDQSTAEFLGPVLQDRWRAGRQIDAPRLELTRRQFDFYARELPIANPYSTELDNRTVAHTRQFLRQFTGTEPIYRSMLSAVSASVQPIEFARTAPNASGVVRDPYVVPGAFTRRGWVGMQAAAKDVERYFKGETWVIGEDAPITADRSKVQREVRELYLKEYVTHWRRFLAAASVERFGGLQDGARKLGILSSNQSPLLALFSLVSRHTAVDTVTIAPSFQPVQVVTPPGDTAKYIGPSNEPYINALVSLQSSLEQIAKAGPDGADAAVSQAMADASQAKLATKQVANKFQIDDAGKVHLIVQKLMEAPLLYLEPALLAVGPGQLNAKGKAFCAPFQQLMAKFPFNPAGSVSAGLDEVSSLLQPGSGALWTFVDGELANYVLRQGSQFIEKPGAPTRVSPSFVGFLNRAAEFSAGLYHGEGSQPSLLFIMRANLSDAVPSLTITIDGRPAKFTRTSAANKRISWTGSEAQEATLSGQVGGREQRILSYQDTWAIFKLFHQADWYPGDPYYLVDWRVPPPAGGSPLRARFEVNMAGAKPILRREFFSGVSCNSRITR